MIVKKDWLRYTRDYKDIYMGIFLLGFIPIYIARHRVYSYITKH